MTVKEFITAVDEIDREDNEGAAPEDQPLEFTVDGRVLHAFPPTDGQLIFMMAALGRGQSQEKRFASILNLLFAALPEEDADYLEERLLKPAKDPEKLTAKWIEQIFEWMVGEWFARPTKSASDSAESPQSDGQKSTRTTTRTRAASSAKDRTGS